MAVPSQKQTKAIHCWSPFTTKADNSTREAADNNERKAKTAIGIPVKQPVGKKIPTVVFLVLAFFICLSQLVAKREGNGGPPTTEYTEWQRPLSGVHSVMMEKLSQAGEGAGVHAHPLLLYLLSRTKFWCTLQLRGQIHSPYFYSTPICTLWHQP